MHVWLCTAMLLGVFMLDWFASKFGMMLFVTIIGMLLLGFFAVQQHVFDKEIEIRHAQNIARLIDTVAAMPGSASIYKIQDNSYNLEIKVESGSGYVIFNGIKRFFTASFLNKGYSVTKSSGNILIKNNGGNLEVQ